MTTTTVTTVQRSPPPDPAAAAAGADTAYVAHRDGSLWRVAPRSGGDAILARLDLHQVGLDPRLAGEVMSGHATLLLQGRLLPKPRRGAPTLRATAVQGEARDR